MSIIDTATVSGDDSEDPLSIQFLKSDALQRLTLYIEPTEVVLGSRIVTVGGKTFVLSENVEFWLYMQAGHRVTYRALPWLKIEDIPYSVFQLSGDGNEFNLHMKGD